MSTRRRVGIPLILMACLGAYLATGITTVAPGEVAVVRRFGRLRPEPWPPGLHLAAPWGIDRVTLVQSEQVRRLDVGLAGTPGATDDPAAGEFLTGDLNLLRARATVQYRVIDPVAFTLAADSVEPMLIRLSEASLARALARQGIDATLRAGRVEAARMTEEDIRRGVDRYRLGIALLGVSLTDARPPSEVAPDFAAAQSAQSAHDSRVNEAKTRAATTVTEAKSRAASRHEQARARADRTIALARAAGRFLAMLDASASSRSLTLRRLYLDALRELLPRVRRKIVLTPDEPLDLSILGASPKP